MSLDALRDGDHSLYETLSEFDILGADEPSDNFLETLPASRTELLSEQGEKAIAFVAQGSLKLPEVGGMNGGKVSQRRVQQLLKAQVERIRNENAFMNGECGGVQGSLINFCGDICGKAKTIATAKKTAALLFTRKKPNGAVEKAAKRTERLLKAQADDVQGGLFRLVDGVDKENQ